LASHNKRETWLSPFLCPPYQDFFGESAASARAEVVCFVDRKPDLLRVRTQSQPFSTTSNGPHPEYEPGKYRKHQVTESIPALFNNAQIQDVDGIRPQGLPNLVVGLVLEQLPIMSHVQLAALDCGEVVTTNYDSLFEAAVNANRDESSRITVLPFEQKKPFDQWILKMHGDLEHDGDLILSRSDFVGYASTFGPVGAIVQAIMLTKHLLVVGTSLTDDNFLRLAYEVTNYLRTNAPDRQLVAANPLGTVLDLEKNPVKESLWEGTFDVVGVSNSTNTNESARDLSIMLDFIAMHAAEESHLLDQRYDTLLTQPGEKDAAAHALSLAREIEPLASAEDDPRSGWRRLHTLLRDLGAPARSA